MYQLETVSKLLQKRGNKKVVLLGGCFDILHIGHIRLLSKAKRLGDIVVIGINDDRFIRLTKGQHRPIIPQSQRAEILMQLKSVDYVFITNRALYDTKNIVQIKPDVLVFGTEKSKLQRRKRIAAELKQKFPNLKIVFLSSGVRRIHTSDIESRIIKNKIYIT